MKNCKFNISGQGNKRSQQRHKLFKQVDVLFDYYRYQLKMPMRLYDVADLFIKAAQYLGSPYNENHAYWDAQAWKKYADAKDFCVDGKFKLKPDYIAAQVAKNQTQLQVYIKKYNIPITKWISIDETMVWADFALAKKTLSLPQRNEPVVWVPNEKDTTTFIGIWKYSGFDCIGLTKEGYKSKKGFEFISKSERNIWWLRVPKEWIDEDNYRFVLLFVFRIKLMQRDQDFDRHNYWGFSDDRATGHASLHPWIVAFMKHFDGIYAPICANITGYTQIADDPLCNGQLKRIIRRYGRDWMRKEIIRGMSDETERKKLVVKVGKAELDQVMGDTMRDMNNIDGIRSIQKAFHRKLDPKRYDVKLRKQLKRWDQIKHKPPEQLFPERQTY